MARPPGAISPARAKLRRTLRPLLQSLPGVIKVAAINVIGGHGWPTTGSVYQYTRFQTLRNMLGGDVIRAPAAITAPTTLWATSSFHMNDSEEFVRGKGVLGRALSSLRDDSLTRTMKRSLKDCSGLEVYCACFSEVDDDLSQWRGYGENGAGVCIEFDLSALVKSINGVGYWVIYGKDTDQATQEIIATELVKYIHDAITKVIPVPSGATVFEEIRGQLNEIWPTLALAFKHSAFEAEREFRIVYSDCVGSPRIDTSFRPAPLVPFVELKMHGQNIALPIKSVRLGPAIRIDINRDSLCLALRDLRPKIEVKLSEIPYVPR